MSRINTRTKSLLAAAVAVGALALAVPASALTLLSASMDTSNQANISGPGVNKNAFIGPVTFHAKDGLTEFDFTAYCVDVYHSMFLGSLNGGAGYDYHPEDLLTDSKSNTSSSQGGDPLSDLQRMEIASLLSLGNLFVTHGVGDLSHRQAGIQGAIWEVENTGFTVTGSPVVNHYISQFKTHAAHTPMDPKIIHSVFADDFGHQAFAYAGGVPEPATWTMMILGFGGVGAVLRRRRQAGALA